MEVYTMMLGNLGWLPMENSLQCSSASGRFVPEAWGRSLAFTLRDLASLRKPYQEFWGKVLPELLMICSEYTVGTIFLSNSGLCFLSFRLFSYCSQSNLMQCVSVYRGRFRAWTAVLLYRRRSLMLRHAKLQPRTILKFMYNVTILQKF